MNKKPRRKFSNEFKAKVDLEALRERESIESLSKKFDLHPNQIIQWKKIYKEGGGLLFSGEKQPAESKMRLIFQTYPPRQDKVFIRLFLKRYSA